MFLLTNCIPLVRPAGQFWIHPTLVILQNDGVMCPGSHKCVVKYPMGIFLLLKEKVTGGYNPLLKTKQKLKINNLNILTDV